MNFDNILAKFPKEVRESPSMQCLIVLIQTLLEQLHETRCQLQNTQEQLTKAQEKIKILEDELAKFRKTPKRPKFRPNGKNSKGEKPEPKSGNSNQPASMANGALAKKEISEITVAAKEVPEGSRFKGYQTFTIQDIVLMAKEITYKLEVWVAPSGEVIRAKLPEELQGKHFGPTLHALTTNLYAQGVSQPALHEFLVGVGIDLSEAKVNDILLDREEDYALTSEQILAVGLKEAPYLRTDDTGEKHKQKSCYCTHIGGEFFAYYTTSPSKSRDNFLKILLQGRKAYHVNDAMMWHLFESGVKDDVLNLFEDAQGKEFKTEKGMNRLMNALGLESKALRKRCIEASLVGFISSQILRPGQILLSDRAGQFALFNHAACWVHMERPLRKIICTSEQAEQELEKVRDAIWTLYRALKEASISQTGKELVHKLYDELVSMKTISPEINDVIGNFHSYRSELLKALDHPGLPLHNNDSERDIRGVAKRRNISGSTKSERGRRFRDGLLTIKQTCFRVGYNFWNYLQLLFRGDPPDLAELVRARYRMASAV